MAKDYIEDLSASSGEDGTEEITINKKGAMPKEPATTPTEAPVLPQRSIRNIAPSGTRPRVSRFGAPTGSAATPGRPRTRPPFPSSTNEEGDGGGKKRTIAIWALVLIVLLAFGFAVSSIFRKTTVTVVPRTHTTVFDDAAVYTAYPSEGGSAPESALRYSTATESVEATMPVSATGTEEVSEASSGVITVYNNFSAEPLRLIKNTRFETPDGKIFRIRDSIVIPGKGASSPGTLTVTVYADEPGEHYNIGPVERFSVPGLRDTPDMFSTVYASSNSAMTGGFVGTRPSITQDARESADAQLKTQLDARIGEKSAANADRYVLGSYADVAYAPLSLEVAQDGSLIAKKVATIVLPVISRTTLDSFLFGQTFSDPVATGITIQDPSTFSIAAANDGIVPTLGADMLDFSLSGTASFVWQVDAAQLATDLAGKHRDAFETVVGGYPSIESATAKVYPLWSQEFPAAAESINVVIEGPARAGQ